MVLVANTGGRSEGRTMTTKTKNKTAEKSAANGQDQQADLPAAPNWDDLLSDENVTAVESAPTAPTKTEDDVPPKLRAIVDASYKDGKYRKVAAGTAEAAAELLKLARLYGQVRKAGQVTIRTSKSDNPSVLIFRAKNKESRPRYTVGTQVRFIESPEWVGTITSTDDKDTFSIKWADESESVEKRTAVELVNDEEDDTSTGNGNTDNLAEGNDE